MLAIEGLEVRHGAVPAVQGISLEARAGEVVGLVGPNGAGKSTTLLAVMGAIPIHGGDVRLGGESVRGRRTEDIVRAGISLVPEGRRVFADLTVEENLRLGLVGRASRDGAEDDLAWVFGLFPIVEEFGARQAGALSGGQQQQLAIARALVARPRVLLLDEPSLGLAPTVVETVLGAIDEVRKAGVAVLLVEQRAQVTVGFADRTHVLSNGRLRLTLTPREAGDTERLVAAYFGT